MPYITKWQTARYHQISFDDALFNAPVESGLITRNLGNTITYYAHRVPRDIASLFSVQNAVAFITGFLEKHAHLYAASRRSMYARFYIPKRSGGLREINAPSHELQEALKELLGWMRESMIAPYHTNAFAYVNGRSTIDAIRRHQQNESRWFLKTDFSAFFPSTTPEFVSSQLRMIYPFSMLYENGYGRIFDEMLSLCFLDGGLPMGTVISPFLTNVIMIPIDHEITRAFRGFAVNGHHERLIYTRYADDMIISCQYNFDYHVVISKINEICGKFSAPYQIKNEKTRYGSSAGSNWNLGVMLNKDNNITVGHKNKKHFRSIMHNFLLDTRSGKAWSLSDLQTTLGLFNYYHMVEPKYFDDLVKGMEREYGLNFLRAIRKAISNHGRYLAA